MIFRSFIIFAKKPMAFKDRLLMIRAIFEQGFGNWKLGVRCHPGLHDFQYQSVRLET